MAMKPYTGKIVSTTEPDEEGGGLKPYQGEVVSPGAKASDPNNRTWGEAAKDTGLAVTQSAANLLGGLTQAANVVTGGAVDNRIVKPLEGAARQLLGAAPGARGIAGLTQDVNDAIDPKYSAEAQREMQELGEAEGFFQSAGKVLSSPLLISKMTAEQAPILALMGRNARKAGKQGTADALAGTAAPTAAQRLAATEAGQAAAANSITRTSAAMGGGYSANEAVQRAMELPEETWLANPEYQALLAAKVDPQTAKERIANSAALPSLLIGGGVNAAASRLNAGVEARIFTGGVKPGGVAGLLSGAGAKKVAQQAGIEAVEEGVTEGAEQFGSNYGVQQIDPNQELMQGVPEGAGAGAVLGGLIGGGMQAAGTLASPSAEPAREDFTPPPSAADQLGTPPPPPPAAETVVPPGATVIDPAAGPLSKAVATTAAAERGDGVVGPVVAPDMASVQANQQEKAQREVEDQALLKDAPAQAAKTNAQATAIATGKPAKADARQPATDDEIRAKITPMIAGGRPLDSSSYPMLARALNVPTADIVRVRREMQAQERAGTAPSSSTPAAGAAAVDQGKEVVSEGQDLFAGQEVRQEEGGGQVGAEESREGAGQEVGGDAAGRDVQRDVVPDAKLAKTLKASRQATGSDGAEYTIRAFSSGEGFYVTRKTETGSTRHQSTSAAKPWSYEQAAAEAAKIAATRKEGSDGQDQDSGPTGTAGVRGDGRGPGEAGQRPDGGAAPAGVRPDAAARQPGAGRAAGRGQAEVGTTGSGAVEGPQVAEGDQAAAAVRTEQGEAAVGGARAAGAGAASEAGAAGDGRGVGEDEGRADVRGAVGSLKPDSNGIVTLKDVYGDTRRVKQADLDKTGLITMYDKAGNPKGKIQRDNLDPDGTQRAAQDKPMMVNARRGNSEETSGFKGIPALNAAIKKQGLDPKDYTPRQVAPGMYVGDLKQEARGTKVGDGAMVSERDAVLADRPPTDDDAIEGEFTRIDTPGKAIAHPKATAPEHIIDPETGMAGASVADLKKIAATFREHIDAGGDAKVTHIFDAPKPSEIVRLEKVAGITSTTEPDPKRPGKKMKVYHRDGGWMTLKEAQAKIREWEDNAVGQGRDPKARSANSQRTVLSLFDVTGEWSLPWEQAGYQVYRFDIQDDSTYEYENPDTGEIEERKVGDVNNMSVEFFNDMFGAFGDAEVYAVLAACPCTDFAVSGAKHFAAKDADGRTVASSKLVAQTMNVIEYFKPAVWALENPVGRIEELTGLPPWRMSFDPFHVGDNYTKKTLLWGRFNGNLPVAPVSPNLADGGRAGMIHQSFGGKSMATKNARSATPEGFSYAFFQANNAIDNPLLAVAGKYDRLDPKRLQKALDAGLTEREISDAVDDAYYMDMDDDAAHAALDEAIAEKAGDGQQDEMDAEMRSYEAKAAATGMKVGQSVRFIGEDGKPAKNLTTIQSIGDDGWVYGQDGSASPADRVRLEDPVPVKRERAGVGDVAMTDAERDDRAAASNPVEAAMQARGMRKTGPLRWVTAGGKMQPGWRELVMDSDTAFVIYRDGAPRITASSLEAALKHIDAPKPKAERPSTAEWAPLSPDERAAMSELYDGKKTPKPSANTIFTEDAAAAARKLLKSKLGQLNSGIDPEMMQAGITLAGYHIEKGARTFAAYSKAMLEDLGDSVKPYLKSWYMAVRYDPRASQMKADMDSPADVDAADIGPLVERREAQADRERIEALPQDERDAEIKRLRAENAQLRAAADLDARTGIRGPAAYDRDLKTAGGVAAIDLSLFKGYNTLLKNAGGDAVLSTFGQAMREVGGDRAYRRGGDEFAFLTETPAEAEALIEQLRETVERIEITMEGADGATYIISGVPFVAGAGNNEQSAETSLAANKPEGDRNALPGNVRRVDGPAAVDEGRAQAPRRQRNPAPEDAGRQLIQSWPGGINGFDGQREDGLDGTKGRFLKDAKDYLNAVGKALSGAFGPMQTEKKKRGGATEKVNRPLVSVNAAGRASSGDVTLSLSARDGTVTATVTVSDSLSGGEKPSIRLNWTAPGSARGPGQGGPNEWLNPETTVGQLADLLQRRLDTGAGPAQPAADPGQAVNDAIAQARAAEQGTTQENDNGRDPDAARGAADGQEGAEGTVAGEARRAGEGAGAGDLFGPAGEGDRGEDRGAGRSGARAPKRRAAAAEGEAGSGNPRRGDRTGVGGNAVDGKPGSRNFSVPLGGLTREGSWMESARRNVDAIELALKLQAEARPATLAEQEILSKYVGFGASEPANKLFAPRYGKGADYDPSLIQEPGWRDIGKRLKAALTVDQLAAMMRSTQYAHYTSEAVTRSIWSAIERMGFDGGRVLEPGMGHGNFPMTAPDSVRQKIAYTGIEMDPLTSLIGRQLVQGGIVLNADYTKQKLPNDTFDVAVGNPPFASTIITADADYRKHRFMLHDYFFAKTLDKVRPGGLLAFVTSAGTMNKGSEKARQYMADRADLLGAIRLPDTAFKDNAGTEVVTDILFFRKRMEGEAPGGEAWMNLEPVDAVTRDGDTVETLVNEYFANHPEMVIGDHSMTGKMYGRPDMYNVKLAEGMDFEAELKKAIAKLPSAVYTRGEVKRDRDMELATGERDLDPNNRKEGGLYVKDGKVMITTSGAGRPLAGIEKLSPKDTAWLTSAIELRDKLKVALQDQRTEGNWQESLKALEASYNAFVKKHGPINEFTESERTERFYVDEDGKETVLKKDDEAPDEFEVQERQLVTRRYKNKRLLGMDVESPMLIALEHETDDGRLVPSAHLKKRSIAPPAPPRIESTHDALIVTLNRKGFLDINMVSELAKVPVDQVIQELGDRIYQNPIDGEWTMADAYLSGDVVTALEEAQAAARVNPVYRRNVDALLKVQPAPLTPRDITVSLGMTWIDPSYIDQFAAQVLGARNTNISYSQNSGQWTVNAPRSKYIRQTDSEYTHATRSAGEILDAVLNNRELKVVTTDKDTKKTYTDVAATTAVNEIAKKMRARFGAWIWEDADRATTVAKLYNTLRNRVIPRTFDGDFIDPPGLAIQFKPGPDGKGGLHPHQKRAIWRQVQTGTTYLAHAVGAGKTLEMIIGAMEQKRLGLISKPMFTVPNHVLGQFAAEFLEAYPTANIMVADEDSFTAARRKQFVAAATINAPDAIIISHSALRLLRVKPETMKAVTDDMIADLEAAIEETNSDDRMSRKKLEAQLEKLNQRIEAKSDNEKQDDVVFFEDMGVDFAYVDEAHEFRKLDFVTNRTNVKGISPMGSAKALDLYAKIRYLHSQRPGRSHVMASGTPVTNTMGELFTVQKFLDYDGMRAAGLHHFDAWASEYGEVATEYERNAAGQYKPVERFAKFNNLPELMQQVRERMDVLTSTQLGELVKRPDVDGGKPDMIVTEASKDLQDYMKLVLEPRIKESLKWKPSPDQPHNPDPMLAIIGDARLAVIDMRFIDPQAPSDPASKLNVMIDRIIDKHGELSDITLPGLKEPGATQIVFSPIGFGAGVAARRGFSARDWMNKRFRDAGIPLEQVAWMSDYNTNRKRKAVFREMRAGRIRILIGSPANMGTGVNVQNRLNQLHFLSPPWFPSDVEQPHGRILRQGNLNPSVGLNWYVTEGTYDSTGWGMVARKGRFIEQVMTGDKTQRSAEDISEVSQYALASALASGDDRAVRVAELESDIGRLNNLQGDYERMQRAAGDDIWRANNTVESRTAKLAATKEAVAFIGDDYIKADNLQLSVNGKPVPGADRAEASQSLIRSIIKVIPASARIAMMGDGFEQQIGMVNGKYPMIVRARPGLANSAFMDLVVQVGPLEQMVIEHQKVDALPADAAGALGITTRLMNAINSVVNQPERLQAEIEAARESLAKAQRRRAAPFPQERELFEKVAELANLKQEMAAESAAAEASANATPTDQTQQPGDPAPAASQPEPGARAAGPSETSIGVNDLRRAMDKIVSGWKGDAPIVKYVQAASELPAAAKRGEWFNAEGWYDGSSTVYLVADNLPNVTRAAQVLAHEAMGHYGVETVTGKAAWAQIVADVARIRTMKGLGKDMKAALASTERRYGGENAVQFAREFLAVMAERGLRSSALGRVLAAVRRWLRSLGFNIESWTENELREVVARGIRSVERGGGGDGSRGTRGAAFSDANPVFYSALSEAVNTAQGAPKKGAAAAWKGWLDGAQRRGEFRQAERDWLGVDAWLDSRDTTTREELAEYIRANQVQVRDVMLGDEAIDGISDALNVWMGDNLDPDMDESIDFFEVAEKLAEQAWEFQDDGDTDLANQYRKMEAEARRLANGTQAAPPKFKNYQLPGGQNYRELLLTLPATGSVSDGKKRYSAQDIQAEMDLLADAETDEQEESSRRRLAAMRQANRDAGPPPEMLASDKDYTGSHFDQPNILAHVRFNERTDADGKRVLFIEEIQSDWHQAGRKRGYAQSDNARAEYERKVAEYDALSRRRSEALQRASALPEGAAFQAAINEASAILRQMEALEPALGQTGNEASAASVPDAPFKATDEWAMLAFKRMARYAVDNGFERIAWTTGEQQAERYDLSKQVDRIEVWKRPDGSFKVLAFRGNDAVVNQNAKDSAAVAELVGKELAEKAEAQDRDETRVYSGLDLKIGGDGMKGFYDKILPSAVGKWAKKFGGKVGKDLVVTDSRAGDAKDSYAEVSVLDITPAMREAVAEGQPAFSLKDPGGAIDKISASVANPKKLAMDKLADWRPALLSLLTLDQLAEISKDETPQVKNYAKGVLKMQTRRNQLQEGAAKIADRWQAWQKANLKEAEVLAGLMHDATIAGVDPADEYRPGVMALHTGESVSLADEGKAGLDRIDLLKAQARGKTDVLARLRADKARLVGAVKAEKERERAYPMLVARFNRLSEDAKGLYTEVRDEYANRSEATMQALLERIGVLGLPDEQKVSLSDKIRTMFESARVTAPYFPLARFGEYWISATKEVDGETEKTFHMAETKAERDKLVAALKNEGWHIAARGVKLDTVKASDGASGQFVAEVIQKLDLAGVEDKVQDEIYQLYLRTLPDLSVRKNFIHRKKVEGYAADALRAFAGHMNHGAHQLARLENSRFLEADIEDLRKAVKEAANTDDDAADRMGRMFNELRKRHEWVMNPSDSAIVQKVSAANFVFYLGVSPAAALVNMLQTATVTFPALAARHGWVRALKETSEAMAAAIRTGGNIEKTAANEQERQALQALQDMGAIDKTLAHDLAGIGDSDSRDFNPLWRKTMKVVSFLFHKAEVMNREASGLAAFRMAIQDGKTFEQAVEAASETIHETHFNYSNANRARFMQGNAAKILFAFKQFSQNMTFFLWRNFYQTMKGATAQERKEARTKLVGTIGMTSLFAGTMGMPLMSVGFGIANAMAAAFGDDDEPFDAETEFRNFLADTLGPELGRIAQVGLVEGGLAALGLPAPAISSRVGLNNLWLRDPDMELEGRQLYNYWLEQAAGPVGGMFGAGLAGYGLMKEGLEKGDPNFLWRGVEAAMPKFIRDGMKGVRYATSGVNTMRGDPLIEDTSLAEWFIQANGFTPARVAAAYEVNRAVKGYEKQIEDRRSSLLDAYALAQRQGDTDTLRATLGKIRKFNQRHRGMAISMATIRRSLQSRADYSERAVNGIVVSNKIPEARAAGRFFAEE